MKFRAPFAGRPAASSAWTQAATPSLQGGPESHCNTVTLNSLKVHFTVGGRINLHMQQNSAQVHYTISLIVRTAVNPEAAKAPRSIYSGTAAAHIMRTPYSLSYSYWSLSELRNNGPQK